MKRTLLVFALGACLSACGSKPPNTPSPAVTPTRIIGLGGNLNFGNVQINQSLSATMNISNSGDSPLTIFGIIASGGFMSVSTLSWSAGTIPAGGSQDVDVRFTPVSPQNYSGAITVNGDQTSGTNTIAFTGTGSLDGIPIFTKSGTGDGVFDVPTYVSRIDIVGTYTGYVSHFMVRIGGQLLVNELLGTGWTSTHYHGTLPTTGGRVAIANSSDVEWSFTEVR